MRLAEGVACDSCGAVSRLALAVAVAGAPEGDRLCWTCRRARTPASAARAPRCADAHRHRYRRDGTPGPPSANYDNPRPAPEFGVTLCDTCYVARIVALENARDVQNADRLIEPVKRMFPGSVELDQGNRWRPNSSRWSRTHE